MSGEDFFVAFVGIGMGTVMLVKAYLALVEAGVL